MILTKSEELEPECPENKKRELEVKLKDGRIIRKQICPEVTYSFDLCAVGQLLDGVTVLCVVLQQDGHLEGGGLQCVPVNNNNSSSSVTAWPVPQLVTSTH